MSGIVISAFPGSGKSHFTYNDKTYNCLDSDSSEYHWIYSKLDKAKLKHPNWPENYIGHIKHCIELYDIVFVSSHDEVRAALKEAKIPYFLAYPINTPDMKSQWLKRIGNRTIGLNDGAFVNMLDTNWDKFIKSCEDDEFGTYVQLTPTSPYLTKNIIDALMVFNDLSKSADVDTVLEMSNVIYKSADEHAIELVREYTINHLDKTDEVPKFDVYTVWKAKVLQNWKFLLSTTLPDKMYYEVTYNGNKNEWYLDAYVKLSNETYTGREIK